MQVSRIWLSAPVLLLTAALVGFALQNTSGKLDVKAGEEHYAWADEQVGETHRPRSTASSSTTRAPSSSFSLDITTGGSVPSSYVFNTSAVKLYHVISDVDYIGQWPSGTDGNLAAHIDQYTHTDSYEYVLELDASGKVIGGEWIGSSKKAHPDFLWLPVSVQGSSVAGGKITYANVKSLLDESVAGATGGSGTVRTVNEAGAVAQAAWKRFGPHRHRRRDRRAGEHSSHDGREGLGRASRRQLRDS